MPPQVVILHGWSDDSTSFKPLGKFLKDHGFLTVPIWLGDYISMKDDVRIEDVAKRMDAVVQDLLGSGQLTRPFDLIVHSTGGLVARQWLSRYVPGPAGWPVKRLVMLAPANFGSRLASMGKSLLGRVIKGWDNWFETGTEMLTALELGSAFQWDLAQRDLFGPVGQTAPAGPYGEQAVWPFVLVGTHPYPDLLHRIVNENGSDGTVRGSAANLNAKGATLDFSKNESAPTFMPWPTRHGGLLFPLVVLPNRDHSLITRPDEPAISGGPDALGDRILEALACQDYAHYQAIQQAWEQISEATSALAGDEATREVQFPDSDPDPEYFHQYLQVVVRVEDDHGVPVTDYFLEFYSPGEPKGAPSTDDAVYFHKEVLEDVHVFGPDRSRRCLFVDRTDLTNEYYQRVPAGARKELAMSISATSPGENIQYFGQSDVGADGEITVDGVDAKQRWLEPNKTHLVRVIIPRNPKDQVFHLTRG